MWDFIQETITDGCKAVLFITIMMLLVGFGIGFVIGWLV